MRSAVFCGASQFHLFLLSLPGQVLLDHCSDLADNMYVLKKYSYRLHQLQTPTKLITRIKIVTARHGTEHPYRFKKYKVLKFYLALIAALIYSTVYFYLLCHQSILVKISLNIYFGLQSEKSICPQIFALYLYIGITLLTIFENLHFQTFKTCMSYITMLMLLKN